LPRWLGSHPGKRTTWAYQVFIGNTWNGSAWVSGGTDYRNKASYNAQVQDPEMGGKAGNFLPSEFFAEALAILISYLVVFDKNYAWPLSTGNKLPNEQTYWDSTQRRRLPSAGRRCCKPILSVRLIRRLLSGLACDGACVVQSNKGSTSSGPIRSSWRFCQTLRSARTALSPCGNRERATSSPGCRFCYWRLWPCATITNLASTVRLSLWYAENGAAGAETVVATTSTTGNSIAGASSILGLLAAASLDFQTSARYTTTTTPATSSQTTAADNALCLAFLSADYRCHDDRTGGTETSRFTDGVSGNRFEGQDFVKAVAGRRQQFMDVRGQVSPASTSSQP